MKKGEIAGILTIGFLTLSMVLMPNTGFTQDQDTVYLWYGNTDGSALDVPIGENVFVDVYIRCSENALIGDGHICLGTSDQYIDTLLEGIVYWAFGYSDFSEPFGSPPNPDGWSSQSFTGAYFHHFDTLTLIIGFQVELTDDSTVIGEEVTALGPGINPFQGYTCFGDTLGEQVYPVVEIFSPLHILGGFIEGTVIDEWDDPIADVSILDENTGGVCTTDLDGFYRMTVTPYTHSFTFAHPYYTDTTITDIVITHQQTTELHVTLREFPTGIGDNLSSIPYKFSLSQNYPNPFNAATSITYTIPDRQYVTLKVYDILGNEIETLVDEPKPAGKHRVEFNASRLASGIYFYSIKAGDYSYTKRMVLLK